MHPTRSVRDMTHHPSNSEIKKPRQHIPFRAQAHLHHSEFEWRAFTGPLGLITVVDALKNGEADLEVRLLRHVRIASVKGGASSAKGEIMRYLAEIAWAPDAILHNHSLIWTVIDGRTLRVSAGQDRTRGELELRLDAKGRIECVFASDRPRKEGSGFVERPWHGRFSDYRRHQERWLPFGARSVGSWLVKNSWLGVAKCRVGALPDRVSCLIFER
jgi:hypothetical protein